MKIHVKCRGGNYTRSTIPRVEIPDSKVPWEFPFEYKPEFYISSSATDKPWSDPLIGAKDFHPKWNQIDHLSKVDRRSFVKQYDLCDSKYPLNPMGRTGIKGRGVLGRWGPNHAADPIVTRWKQQGTSAKKVIHETSQKPILQFVAILRGDTKEWAIPGGMVDPGEVITETLKREFLEEAMNFLEQNDLKRQNMIKKIDTFFKEGVEIYKGYVDDPRNTDNAWMETVAYNFHDEDGKYVQQFNLHAGDDAVGVKWMDISSDLSLYASHKDMIHTVAKKHGAHW